MAKQKKNLTPDQIAHLTRLASFYDIDAMRVGSKELITPSNISMATARLVVEARRLGVPLRAINEACSSPRTEAFWHRVIDRFKEEMKIVYLDTDIEEIEFNGKTVKGSIETLRKLVG